ncbi:alpha beta-hydrolase [Artomyces pyxidatus]|uniref:Alpha beta-hydrolase n=1 Tax=Artomyces pyxidatus TaxID=48021 RepID=A0ACB8TGQ0_9AGAM|nr:alpha beta-hydrolase [Artomyces pyxidatus]
MSSYTETWLPAPNSPYQFYTRTYTPKGAPRGAVVFIHGFIEHVARYTHAHEAWAARGFVVFTFDQRGFGRTALDGPNGKAQPGSIYGRTGDKEQVGDVEWAIKHVRVTYEGVPIFLMGHSMGGGLSLSFATRQTAPPSKETISLLTGVIVSSPLIRLTSPPVSMVRWLGGRATTVMPNFNIPASVEPKHLSHDPVVCEENTRDPLIKRSASLRAVDDMLNRGEALLVQNYKDWPKNLPVFIVQGSDDRVCSPKASQEFFDKVPATDKKITFFPGGYHELQNEPDGVKEKFFDTVISWAEEHLPFTTGVDGTASSKL